MYFNMVEISKKVKKELNDRNVNTNIVIVR